jgi:hypothetical protein
VQVFAAPAVGYMEVFVHGTSLSFPVRKGKGGGAISVRVAEQRPCADMRLAFSNGWARALTMPRWTLLLAR